MKELTRKNFAYRTCLLTPRLSYVYPEYCKCLLTYVEFMKIAILSYSFNFSENPFLRVFGAILNAM